MLHRSAQALPAQFLGELPQRAHRRRRWSSPAAAFVPYGSPPTPANEPSGPPAIQRQAEAQVSSSFPVLSAPQLTLDIQTDLLDASATAPHWGSTAVSQSVQSAAQWLRTRVPTPAGGELAQLLGELQALVSSSLQQLSSLPQLPDAGEQQLSGALAGSLEQVAAQLQRVASSAQQAAESLGSPGGPADGGPTQFSSHLSTRLGQLSSGTYAGYSLQTLAWVAAGVAALIALSVPRDGGPPGGSGGGGSGPGAGSKGGAPLRGDTLPSSWDAQAVSRYFATRPVLVARRLLQVAGEALGFGAALALDAAAGRVGATQAARADQAMAAIERLGPAWVKIAQALSTRVDLLPPAYLEAIQRLQDRVPPFPDALAFASMEAAAGRPLGEVYSELSPRAVAAASLGQVYRGRLRSTGQEVAIKVRRPGVLDSVSLDLYLMRGLAQQLAKAPQVRSDWVGIIDAWAARFLDEMNYTLEAANAARFASDLASLPGVVVPEVVADGSSADVLVTGWVEGERLSDSAAGDVRALCDTLLSAYLIQLLDTGLLHADPHPGNLLRTTDGRIAILDHGLIQEVPPDYSLTLLEYIAHLSVGDWDALADDLVALGFVDSVQDKERLVGPLGIVLTELSAGGGAKKVNIAVVSQQIEQLSQEYELKVPPIFALILRTFSVIEGIALQADPNYSIVRECFPYLSRRLLTDDNPRAREALRQLLFAGGDSLSLERVERLVGGLSAFTVDGLTGPLPGAPRQQQQLGQGGQPGAAPAAGGEVRTPLLDSTAREVLAAVFSERPTYVQELLVGQAASTADAALRQLAASVLGPALGGLGAARAAAASGGQVAGAGAPPAVALLARLPALVELSAEDRRQLQTAQGITSLLRQQQPAQAQLTPAQAQQLASELAPLLPQLLPGVAATAQLFVRQLGERATSRVSAVLRGDGQQGDEYTALD